MKVYKVELLILDFDNLGEAQIVHELENANFPNDCISPSVESIECREIGPWRDDHPLNLLSRRKDEYERLFPNLGESIGYKRTNRDAILESSAKSLAALHARSCQKDNCEYCDRICREGQIISCDSCGFIEHTDWKWWRGVEQEDGRVAVFCDKCKDSA